MSDLSVSIALATYNGEKYLREQLESLLAQTLPFTELVVCDDRSTDRTRAVLEEYARRDGRIKVYANEHNLGFKRNFEKALSLCSGDLIALCDQDDIWLPTHLETLRSNMDDKMLVCADALLIDGAGRPLNRTLSGVKNFRKTTRDNASVFRFVAYYQNPFQGASMMMRREFLSEALPVPDTVRYHDVWFAFLACLGNAFAYSSTPVTLYRIHGGNASGSHAHKTVVRTILGHLLKKELNINRKEVIEALMEREGHLDEPNRRLVAEAAAYYFPRRTLKKRIENLIFELKNYKSIYGRH